MRLPIMLVVVLLLFTISLPMIARCQVIDDITLLGSPLADYNGHNSLEYVFPFICRPQLWSPDGTYAAWITQSYDVNMVFHTSGIPTLVYHYNQFAEEIDEYSDYGSYYSNPVSSLTCSPDGRTIAITQTYCDSIKGGSFTVSVNEDLKQITGSGIENGIERIVLFSIETGESEVLADGYEPCWSPDGRYLAYKTYDYRTHPTIPEEPEHHGELTYYDTVTGETMFTGIIPDSYPVFSTDSQSIYYGIMDTVDESHGLKHGTLQMVQVPLAGGEPEVICTIDDCYIHERMIRPSLSPDGSWLTFQRRTKQQEKATSAPEDTQIYHSWSDRIVLLNLETHQLYEVFDPEGVERIRFMDAQFSHDGSRLCFYGEEYYLTGDFATKGNSSYEQGYFVTEFNPSALYSISSPTAVAEDAPEPFLTLRNFPNPFNNATTISYAIPESGKITLAVYSPLGQKVAALVDEYKSAGMHTASLNMSGLASGVYLYRLDTPTSSKTAKMLLMK